MYATLHPLYLLSFLVPPAPRRLVLLPINSTAINVAWQPYDEAGVTVPGMLLNFRVFYNSSNHGRQPTYLLVQASQ